MSDIPLRTPTNGHHLWKKGMNLVILPPAVGKQYGRMNSVAFVSQPF